MDTRYESFSKPFWFDACHHGEDCYVGSFTMSAPGDYRKLDVYVWIQHGHQHLCIRYGDKNADYMSAGAIHDLMYPTHIETIDIALSILRAEGEFVWHKGGVVMWVKGRE